MDCITEVRYYHFIVGVLTQQQHDPFCCRCKTFINSVRAIRDGMAELEERRATEAGLLPERQVQLLAYATTALAALRPDPDAEGQKKAGNCRLAEGICFVKSSKSLIQEREERGSGSLRE